MRYVYLLKVEPDANNNKFYEMQENTDGTFTATYGRVDHTSQVRKYPISMWDRKYNEKLGSRKGYTDVTKYRAQVSTNNPKAEKSIQHESNVVMDFFRTFKEASNTSFKKNYNVSTIGIVTQMMIDDAQATLNRLADTIDAANWVAFNDTLKRLFLIIPRRMDGKVADYMLDLNRPTERSASALLDNEQSLLDVVRGQVYTGSQDGDTAQDSLFDVLGLKAADPDPDEIRMIKQKLGEISGQFHSAIRIAHQSSLDRFQNNLNKLGQDNLRLEWHGSRTENWLSILSTGLMLYPTSARITGKMFGYSLYFSPKARKSAGYTSLRNAYWTSGNDNFGYLALFHLNMGRMLEVKHHESWHTSLTADKLAAKGYDSLYAHAGYDLRNPEMMVYTEPQATIGYLVKITS